jgi:pimeloyl-ACP methyl ester carboxylesterase
MMKEPDDSSDYIATLDADLAHDATEALPQINAPTLVIAGLLTSFTPSRSFVRRPSESRMRHCGCTTGSATP